MISTYLSYDLVNRNYKGSLDTLSKQNDVSREAKYYKDNIGSVKTVGDFVKNYRLFSYAMKAYGLEDMTYATAFMKKVLESDLTDDNSFANKLTDERYKKFAAAFQTSSGTAVAQTNKQTDDVIAAYKQHIDDESQSVATENAYYKTAIAGVTTVDGLLNNDRLRSYVLDAFHVNSPYWSKDFLTQVLTSDVNDANSFVNQLTVSNKADYRALAAAFNFNSAGALDSGVTAQTTDQTQQTMDAYTFSVPDRLVQAGADLNKQYFESKIGTITNVDQLVGDSRMLDYVKTAYGLTDITLVSTIKNILTSDLADPNNYATVFGGAKYEALTKAFNFSTDGTISGTDGAQTAAQTTETSAFYMNNWNSAQSTADDDLYSYYQKYITNVNSVSDLHGTSKLYDFVLVAFGFDPNTVNDKNIDKALESDLNDPKSWANTQKDTRYKELASAFNFDAKGDKDIPDFIQSQATMQEIAKEYIVEKTKFLTGNAQKDERTKATDETKYYTDQIQRMETRDELLKNTRVMNFVLEAKGIDPKTVTPDFLKKIFTSDLNDPKSFVNQQTDHRFVDIVASFNFDKDGKMVPRSGGFQDQAGVLTTNYLYLQQTLEEQTGEDSEGARLALYFKRQLPTMTSGYDILGDSALLQVFRTTYSLPAEMSSMDIDKQKAIIDKYLDLQKLQDDPKELDKFITRFTAMYDLENNTTTDPVLALFDNSAASAGISATLLESLSQNKF